MAKIIKHSNEAREAIRRGIDTVADTVKRTLGPKGRNVIIHNAFGSPLVTNDGVTIAAHIYLKDEFEELGAQLIKQVAWNSNERAGDGTTTATILAQAIISVGMKLIDMGETNPMVLRKQINEAVIKIVEEVKKNAIPVSTKETVEHVGTVSSGDPEVGKLFGELFEKLGPNGVVTMEQSFTPGCTAEVVEGFEFDRGFIHPLMMTDPNKMIAEIRDVPIIVCDHVIASPVDLAAMVKIMAEKNRDVALLICGELTADALEAIVRSRMQKHFNIIAVRAPGVGENQSRVLEDVATLVGAKYFSRERGEKLTDLTENDFGSAKRVIVEKSTTRIIEGGGDKEAIKERARVMEEQLKETDNPFDKTVLSERLERFSSGIGVIKVGAVSETELKEKVYRVEDAINAVKHSIQGGIVTGGGVTLFKARKVLDNPLGYSYGEMLLRTVLEKPIKMIMENAGEDERRITRMLKEIEDSENLGLGYNADTEQVENLLDAGVVDPAKVVISEIENAASVANTLLTIEAAICEEPGKELELEDIKKDFNV